MSHARRLPLVVVAVVLLMTACGSDSSDGGSTTQPTVVVSTTILGDVVGDLVGDRAQVVTIMPPGASPHEFSPSARQVAAMADADAIVVNGAGFEGGLRSVIDNAVADGVPVYEAISAVDTRTFGNGDTDPHFFTDPRRMAEAVRGIAEHLRSAVPALDDDSFATATDVVVADLEGLDAEAADILAAVPPERRQLVTDHEVFGYFADRYGFEVVDTIVPTGSTADGASGAAPGVARRHHRAAGAAGGVHQQLPQLRSGRRPGRRGRRRPGGGPPVRRVPRRSRLRGCHLRRHDPHRRPPHR